MPKISIITPVYNGASYLRETIESVQRQSFADYEHIIIDDCSLDNSLVIEKEYTHDDRIKLIQNQKNLGIAGTRNVWLSESKGEYICFLDHDDLFLDTNKLQRQSDFLDTHPEYVIVSSGIITIDSKGKELHKSISRQTDEDIRNHFLQSNQFLPCAMMIRKTAIDKTGGFDSKYNKSDDYDLWMKVGLFGKMCTLPEYMTGYRIHGNNASASLKSLYYMRILAWRIFWKNRKHYPHFLKALILRSIEFLIPPKWVDLILKVFR